MASALSVALFRIERTIPAATEASVNSHSPQASGFALVPIALA